jgi:hypothetical protein
MAGSLKTQSVLTWRMSTLFWELANEAQTAPKKYRREQKTTAAGVSSRPKCNKGTATMEAGSTKKADLPHLAHVDVDPGVGNVVGKRLKR